MAIEFQVELENKPGALARLGKVLGDSGVNIDAIQGMSLTGKSVMHFVTDDPLTAVRALEVAGYDYHRREVVCVRVLDEPGMLGEVAFVMCEAGINIDAVYASAKGHVVLGVDDVPGALQIAGGMAVMAHG